MPHKGTPGNTPPSLSPEGEGWGAASKVEAEELIAFAEDLRQDVLAWLKEHYPTLLMP
jgi:hypothetical protein